MRATSWDAPKSLFSMAAHMLSASNLKVKNSKSHLAVPAASAHAGVYTRPNREALYDL